MLILLWTSTGLHFKPTTANLNMTATVKKGVFLIRVSNLCQPYAYKEDGTMLKFKDWFVVVAGTALAALVCGYALTRLLGF